MSTSSTSAASTTIPGFNGTSTFATDLQKVITRAVGIASLPITSLQNQQNALTDQQAELQTLGSKFADLGTALRSLSGAVGSGSLAASVDAPAVASASASSGALAGSYAVTITSLGAQTNTVSNSSLPAVSNPSSASISTSSTFSLTVGAKTYSLTPAANNLNSLVRAINASGANVQATVVNVGGSTAPNYQLSIQGTQYAPTAIQLNDGSQDLLSTLNSGSYVAYQVNGQPTTPATSASRSLSISTGLTVTALATGSANVTVAQNASGIQTAFQKFVSGFNAAVDEIAKNRGQNGGALAGQSIVAQLQSSLQNLAGYSGAATGTVQSLADLGIAFDQTGHLQFDSSVFSEAAANSLSGVTAFLGSSTGGGFLTAATSALSAVTDSSTGVITQQTNSVGSSINNITAEISSQQDRITQLQASLTKQIAQADAAIASLQSKQTQITNLFLAQTQASKNITG